MTRTKLGLLGLCAMLFGLMAINATGANAAGQWLFAEAAGTKLVPFLEAELELKKDSSVYVLHSEALKLKILYLCTEIKADAKLISEGRIGTNGKPEGGLVLFSGCIADIGGVEAKECNPKEGKITTTPGHAVLSLHELGGVKDDLVKVLPDSTAEHAPFAIIESTSSCPFGQKVPIIGKLTLKDCQNLALTHLAEHLVEPFEPLTELFVISLTVEHKATLLGSAWALLGGAHKGLKFSGDPE